MVRDTELADVACDDDYTVATVEPLDRSVPGAEIPSRPLLAAAKRAVPLFSASKE
jgi:hypothetical protein